MTDAYLTRPATAFDLDVLAPMLSSAFASPAKVILPRGHTDDSIRFRRSELEHWYLQCATEKGGSGTDQGQKRLMVVCEKPTEADDQGIPIGFCQYEMVEPGMREGIYTAKLPEMAPFPAGGDKAQYYLWKQMISETRRAAMGHCRHGNVITMVVGESHRNKGNSARRAISDYCSKDFLAWGDIPCYNDAYPRAAPLWLRTGWRPLHYQIKTKFDYGDARETNPTKEVAKKRGEVKELGDGECYITIPQVRWSVHDRDLQAPRKQDAGPSAKL